jgi:hypothetical protein
VTVSTWCSILALAACACGSRTGPLAGERAGTGTDAALEPGDGGSPPRDASIGDSSGDGGSSCAGTICGAQCVDTSSDPLNCGKCGHGCLGGACVTGACQPATLASGRCFEYLAVNSTAVFAGVPSGGIVSVALPGGAPVLLTAQGLSGLATKGSDVFWVNDSGLWVARGGVASGVANLVSDNQPISPGAGRGIATDDSHVYWFGQALHSVKLDGSSLVSLPSDGIDRSLATDGLAVYWATTAEVGSTALPGGPATQLATGLDVGPDNLAPNGLIAVDDTNIYVGTSGPLTKLPKQGGIVTTLDAPVGVVGVAVDTTDVYFAAFVRPGGGQIMRLAKGGGQLMTLGSSQPNPQAIALDAVSIFWVNQGTRQDCSDGSVMRLAK